MSMTEIQFWLGVAVLSVLALICVLKPLLKRPVDSEFGSRELDVALYKEQQTEITIAVSEGRMTPEQAAQSQSELDARLLDEAGSDGVTKRWQDRGNSWLAICMTSVFAVGASLALYLHLGDWERFALQDLDGEALVERLADEMQHRPDNVEGWLLLARSYQRMGENAKAADAYAQINQRAPAAETLVAEAEMRVTEQGGDWQGLPTELINRAVAAKPSYGPALWYSGLIAYGQADWGHAAHRWEQLARLDLPPEFRAVVEQRIEQTLDQLENAGTGLVIPVTMTLGDNLAKLVADGTLPPAQSGAMLYVVAKSAEGGMPLAVVRRPYRDLPVTLRLHEGAGMTEQARLADHNEWEVIARVSMSGHALPQPGDWMGRVIIDRHSAASGVVIQLNTQ